MTEHENQDEWRRLNEEIEKELLESLEAKQRGEEYSFEDDEDVDGGKHYTFLFIMTTILVIIVLMKIIFMIAGIFMSN